MVGRARKYFGQHFLHDGNIIGKIIAAIDPESTDHILEIGPGHGALTRPLLEHAGRVDAVEIDRDLAAELGREISDARFSVHCGDALKFDFSQLANAGERLRVCGNLPYNISTPLLFHLLSFRDLFSDIHVMLQKEVVDRMAAPPGSRTYGRLSVALGARCHIERLFTIKPGSFTPPPKVDSAFVRLTPDAELLDRIRDEKAFNSLITRAFSMRRKTLANALRGYVTPEQLEKLQIDPGIRPEKVSVEQFIALADAGDD
jgi:16S rRNA (adenine1518-N6/adenine1519-N6)-dimethyltransferase